ncbi:MAG: zeta toxin family protein [Bacteroidota bacterium]|nr:zeta toxin family protein [Bacteroidota bacterium]MDP4258079.1 zeta toxin family protein [Bacteroidota bacterium]
MPELYIITGSNGAGKSSIGPEYLPPKIRQTTTIFDGDKLFMQKRSEYWRSGIKSHKECKKMAWEFVEQAFDALIEKALADNTDIAYEGHFTNEATWDIPRRFREAGYLIHLIFFGLRDTSLSELRVVDRAQEGGHYVDPITVANNYFGNLEKLDKYFNMFHTVQIADTSEAEHRVLVILENGLPTHAVSPDKLPAWFQSYLPSITQKIKEIEPS